MIDRIVSGSQAGSAAAAIGGGREGHLPISCFVITRNEQDVIAACLASVVGLVDEIVVMDSGSRDGTLACAAKFGARIVEHPWSGYGPQKQAAERVCSHDWLLNLDADEVVTAELAAEIRSLFANGPPHAFYAVPRALVYPGRSRPAPTRRDRAVRLYNRTRGGFSDRSVHESVTTAGARVGQLENSILHYSARSLHHLIDKNLNYAVISAVRVQTRRSTPLLYARLLLGFPVVFVRSYIVRGHCLTGMQGLVIALSIAFAEVLKIATAIEARGCWTDQAGFRRGPSSES